MGLESIASSLFENAMSTKGLGQVVPAPGWVKPAERDLAQFNRKAKLSGTFADLALPVGVGLGILLIMLKGK